MSFADDLRKHTERVQKLSRAAFVDTAIAVHESVTDGSELTGAPGQPVDTGYLRSSWLLGFGGMPAFALDGSGPDKDPAWTGGVALPSFTLPSGDVVEAYIVTNAIYAPDQEDNTRGARRLSPVGGSHSVKLTRAGLQNIVDHVVSGLAE